VKHTLHLASSLEASRLQDKLTGILHIGRMPFSEVQR
jgi:hypothetical protein